MKCPVCGEAIEVPRPIGRRDTCPRCDADLHACRCCAHYDPKAYNECREPQAERVLEKEAGNFCDFFVLSGEAGSGDGRMSEKDKAKAALDALFKK